jgi:hypothetical protein
MLFSPVYTETHPRRIAAHAASRISSNSFASYSFRTLLSHFQATVSSNTLEIKRFRTLCKIPGIGYPPSLNFSSHSFAARYSSCIPFTFNGFRTLMHNGAPQPPYFQTLPDSFHCNGGVYPLSFTQSALCEGPHSHHASIPASAFQKLLRYWLFDPVKSSGFHAFRSTGHSLPAVAGDQVQPPSSHSALRGRPGKLW